MTYVTEEKRSRTGWIGCQVLAEILADGTSPNARKTTPTLEGAPLFGSAWLGLGVAQYAKKHARAL